MNEDFVTCELAVKLKEKGFDEPCYGYYRWYGGNDSFELCGDRDFLNSKNQYRVAAHTIPQVLKWLRNTRKLFIYPCVITDYQDDFHRDTTYWSFIVVNIESGDSIYREYERVTEKRYETYEEAALAGIEYVLDNLI